MDISAVESKLGNHEYSDYSQFEDDVRLIWTNSFAYNAPCSEIYKMTTRLRDYFEEINSQELKMQNVQKMGEGLVTECPRTKQGDDATSKAHGMQKPMTYQEKKTLSRMIWALDSQYLLGVWEIVSETINPTENDQIEFDLDAIPVVTARKLEKYVQGKINIAKKTQKKPMPEVLNSDTTSLNAQKQPPVKHPKNEPALSANDQIPTAAEKNAGKIPVS